VTKSELIDQVSEATGFRKKDVITLVEAVFDTMVKHLKKHEKVQIVGFGAFEPRRRRPRMGRDPRNQKKIRIAGSWSVGFRAAKQLKEKMSQPAPPRRRR